MMKFKDYIKALEGLQVMAHVKHLSDIPRDDGAKWCVFGLLRVGDDFITLQASEGEPPVAIRIKDIITIEQDIECECECDEWEEEGVEDLERKLWQWEREKGGLGS